MSWWTKERTQALIRFYEAGLTRSVIAARMTEMFGTEVSRSKVIAKLDRLGLTTHRKQGRPQQLRSLLPRKLAKPAAQVPPARQIALHDEPHVAPLPLLLRKHHQCGWPVNDGGPFLFCALPKAPGDQHYCEFHRKLSMPTERGRRLMLNRRLTA